MTVPIPIPRQLQKNLWLRSHSARTNNKKNSDSSKNHRVHYLRLRFHSPYYKQRGCVALVRRQTTVSDPTDVQDKLLRTYTIHVILIYETKLEKNLAKIAKNIFCNLFWQ